MLPAFIFSSQDLFSFAGGLAAAIAIGAFVGQAWSVLRFLPEDERHRRTAIGGLFGFLVMIGLILVSGKGS